MFSKRPTLFCWTFRFPFTTAITGAASSAKSAKALLRRTYDFGAGVNALACRGAVLDLKDASLHYNGQKLELTKNEFRILQLLFERRGRTVPREDIMQALWESDSFIDDNTLTVNVARLRAHLAEIGLEGFIRTQKGLGYLVDET